jgi:hypothetical protein
MSIVILRYNLVAKGNLVGRLGFLASEAAQIVFERKDVGAGESRGLMMISSSGRAKNSHKKGSRT